MHSSANDKRRHTGSKTTQVDVRDQDRRFAGHQKWGVWISDTEPIDEWRAKRTAEKSRKANAERW